MANTATGNKNKLKNNSGVMDSYLQKDQIVTPLNNKRQSNVLSPLEEEKSKVKKKNLKSTDHEREARADQKKNRKKLRGKRNQKNSVMNPCKEIITLLYPLLTAKQGEEITSGHDLRIDNSQLKR